MLYYILGEAGRIAGKRRGRKKRDGGAKAPEVRGAPPGERKRKRGNPVITTRIVTITRGRNGVENQVGKRG